MRHIPLTKTVERDLSKEKEIQNMYSEMTANTIMNNRA